MRTEPEKAPIDLEAYRGFVFDLDGTLIDSEKYHAEAFAAAMLEATGYVLTREEKREFFGHTSLFFAGELGRRHGLALDAASVTARKFAHLGRIFRAEVLPGAVEFLAAWHARVPLAVASNSPRHFVEGALRELGLYGRFDYILTCDDVEHRKPAPDIFLLAARVLGHSPSDVLVFEDTVLGITAAQAAGCAVLRVDNGMPLIGTLPPGVPGMTWAELGALCANRQVHSWIAAPITPHGKTRQANEDAE